MTDLTIATDVTDHGDIPAGASPAGAARTSGSWAGAGRAATVSGLGGDLATVGAARRQARQADALAEQLGLLVGVITGWCRQLPDRLAGATWGTEGITGAGDAVSGAATDLPALVEALAALEHEVGAAELVGAEASAVAAAGHADGFTQD